MKKVTVWSSLFVGTSIFIAACSSGGGGDGGDGGDGGSGGGGDGGSGGGGGGEETGVTIHDIVGSNLRNVTVDGVALSSSIVSNGGATLVYNPVEYMGQTVTPVGASAGTSSVILGNNPFENEDNANALAGISSDFDHSTDNSVWAGYVFDGNFQEIYYNSSGATNGFASGDVSVTVAGDSSSISFAAGDSIVLDGQMMVWDADLNAFVYDDPDLGYGEAYVYGDQDIVGGYSGSDDESGVTGTFAATAQ